jgi:hypothetical protein
VRDSRAGSRRKSVRVKEYALALFHDLIDETCIVPTALELDGQFVKEIVADVGQIFLGRAFKSNGMDGLERRHDVRLRTAGDNDANPVRQARAITRKHFHERIVSGVAGFVERVNDDETPVPSTVDGVAKRIGEEVVEQFGGVLPVQRGEFRQREQEFAVIGQPCRDLKGQGCGQFAPGFGAPVAASCRTRQR